MDIKANVIDSIGLDRTITRLAHEIIEHNKGSENIVLIGMRTRGEFLAKRIQAKIESIDGKLPNLGILDATLYRDDFRTRLKQPEVTVTDITFDLNEKNVDYLRPKLVNKLISEYVPSVTKETMHNLKGKRISFLYPLFVLLNLPIILVWRFMVKPKVWEPEFIGTLRFATALLGFSFYYSGLFIALTFLNGAGFALAAILILFIFNWVYIKYA